MCFVFISHFVISAWVSSVLCSWSLYFCS